MPMTERQSQSHDLSPFDFPNTSDLRSPGHAGAVGFPEERQRGSPAAQTLRRFSQESNRKSSGELVVTRTPSVRPSCTMVVPVD